MRFVFLTAAMACNNIEGTWTGTSYDGNELPAEDCSGIGCAEVQSFAMSVEKNDNDEHVGEYRSKVSVGGFTTVLEFPIQATQNDDGMWELVLELGNDTTYSGDDKWVCDVGGRSMSCEIGVTILFEKE